MTNTSSNSLNLRQVSRCYFTATKKWWIWTWVFRLFVFLAAIPAIWWPQTSFWCALGVGILSLTAEFCSLVTISKKGYAEGVLRKLDLHNSFGWEVENAEIADLLQKLSKKDKARVDITDLPDDYFASTDTSGWRRAIENLQESAWWSKHLSIYMVKISAFVIIGLILISIISLLLTAQVFSNEQTITNASQVIISVLLLVASLGLISLALDYYSFQQAAEKVEIRATALLKEHGDKNDQAIKLWNEYHLARAASPLTPDWLWKMKKDYLNKTWSKYVQTRR